MIPLSTPQLPSSPAALADAVTGGFARFGITTRAVNAEGGTWPEVDRLHVDLTGARLTREVRLPLAGGSVGETIAVGDFAVAAAPLHFETLPLQLDLRGSDAVFGLAKSNAGETLLALTELASGEVTVEATRIDLEVFAHALISTAAGKQGVEIKSTHLELTPRGPRSMSFRVEITAKMFIMSAKVAVSGMLEIDDRLEARLSDFKCAGDGMIASTANAFLRPHFAKLEGRSFPLLALPLGAVKLRDVTMEGGDSLRIHARFGG